MSGTLEQRPFGRTGAHAANYATFHRIDGFRREL